MPREMRAGKAYYNEFDPYASTAGRAVATCTCVMARKAACCERVTGQHGRATAMGEWKTIDSAPKDREIELRVRRKAFRAKWDFVCWQSDIAEARGDDDVPCHAWCATTDDYPSDWDDGVCWFVNGDGRRSSRPSAWREIPSRSHGQSFG